MIAPLALSLAGLTSFLASGAESAPCPSGTIGLNVTSEADIHKLTQVFNCTGQGSFNVKWYSSVTLAQRIDISSMKNVTITGSGFPTIRGGLGTDENDRGEGVDPDKGTAIFSVSNGSTLRLSHLVLTGGQAENGGAVYLVSSSTLFVFGCTFANNNASNGGGNTSTLQTSRNNGKYDI